MATAPISQPSAPGPGKMRVQGAAPAFFSAMSSPPALRILSVIPPMTQLNTPYPSTAYLTGFLRSRGIAATQVDLALELVLALFSPQGLRDVREALHALPPARRTPALQSFDDQFD